MEKKINNSISIKTNNEVFYDIFLKNFLKKYNNKIFNNFYLYFELKKSNAYDYIKKETEYDSIFISTSISLKYNLSYCFLTRNSRNTIYTKYYNISDDLFNFYIEMAPG